MMGKKKIRSCFQITPSVMPFILSRADCFAAMKNTLPFRGKAPGLRSGTAHLTHSHKLG